MKIDFNEYKQNTLKEKVIQDVINKAYENLGQTNQYKMMMGFQTGKPHTERFSFVVALPLPFKNVDWNDYLGYLVQIRVKDSVGGSDSILIRTPNGNLQNWGNQSFLILPQSEVDKILPFFNEELKDDKEYIDNGGTYTVDGGNPHNEYIFNKSD